MGKNYSNNLEYLQCTNNYIQLDNKKLYKNTNFSLSLFIYLHKIRL